MKEVTKPHLFPSHAVVFERERAKRWQGRMWVGLLSTEKTHSECRGFRCGRRQHCSGRYGEVREVSALPEREAVRSPKSRQIAARRMDGAEKSDSGIVPGNPANKAGAAPWRSRWRKGHAPNAESGSPAVGLDAGLEQSGTDDCEGARHVSAHVRIWATATECPEN